MSIRTAAYTRLTLTPKNQEGHRVPPSPAIAALSPRARHLWEVLSNLANLDGETWPPVAELADRMGITAANVRRARTELVEAGVVTVETGGGARANRYRFPVRTPFELSTPRADTRGVDDPHPARERAGARAVARDVGTNRELGINTRRDPTRDEPASPDDRSARAQQMRAVIRAAADAEHARIAAEREAR